MKQDVTREELLKRLSYDADTGHLTWTAKGKSKKVVVGTRAGSISPQGHRVIRLNGFLYAEHRLIWFLYYGEWPKYHIDHINHNEQDNRINNLRDVPKAVNNRNQSKRSNNTTGYPGIWINKQNSKKRYMSELHFKGKRVHLQSHYSLEEAIECRRQKLVEYGFHPNHGMDKPN